MFLLFQSRAVISLIFACLLFNYTSAQGTQGAKPVDPLAAAPTAATGEYGWQNNKGYPLPKQPTPPSDYWLQNIPRQGSIPYGQFSRFNKTANSNYPVFRNVRDYGAFGDGIHDDTAAIQMAINGSLNGVDRCNQFCDSSTTTPALIYFPAGTYMISSSLVMFYYTQMVGDATNLPTIRGAPNFKGIAMLDADPYALGGQNWFTNQNNFFRQVRNFIIDMTQMPSGASAESYNFGIHWQVSQATSLQNIIFNMVPGGSQSGVWMDNGSSTFLGDLIFNGGGKCLYVGNQQYTIRNITFNGCQTGIYQNWGWVTTYTNLVFNDCKIGLDMSNGGAIQVVGSVAMQDSEFHNTDVGIFTTWSNTTTPTSAGSLVLDNVDMTGTNIAGVNDTTRNDIVPAGTYVKSFMQGQAYTSYFTSEIYLVDGVNKTCLEPGATGGRIQQIMPSAPTRPALLTDANGKYVTRYKPQYEGEPVEAFVSVKNNKYVNLVGDGITDETAAMQQLFDAVDPATEIVYFDHGAYVISDTITLPPNIRITGEIWPLIMMDGSSPNFNDESNPRPGWRVGNPGETGNVEISDIIFETLGPAPGLIMMEWNMAGLTKGSAGIWDSHWRIGGSAGTKLQADSCLKNPLVTHGPNAACIGAFLLMHITTTGSVYMENNWGWVADHELDMNPYIGQQIDIYNGRGLLVESTAGVWLVGSAFEHSQMYNYQVSNANAVYMGAIQAEAAYMQQNPNVLVPFTPNPKWNDPLFEQCTQYTCFKTYGLRIVNSNEIFVFGAGLYSFFDNYDQGCLITENCQQFMIQLDNSSEIYLYNPQTKASANIIAMDGVAVLSNQGLQSTFCQGAVYFEEP